MNLPIDLQNDLIEVFDKIREQKIGNKTGEYDCANDEALKLIEPILIGVTQASRIAFAQELSKHFPVKTKTKKKYD